MAANIVVNRVTYLDTTLKNLFFTDQIRATNLVSEWNFGYYMKNPIKSSMGGDYFIYNNWIIGAHAWLLD